MAFDYSELASVASELISEFGRSITLLKTPRTPADATEPWKGPENWDDDDAPAGHKLSDVKAVFVSDSGRSEGTEAFSRDTVDSLIRRGTNGFILAPVSGSDLKQFDHIDDGGKLWKIDRVNELKPGATVLLHGIEVSQ